MCLWGKTDNANIIWRVNCSDKNRDTEIAKTMLTVKNELPKYHTRQMKKDFVEKYQKVSKISSTAFNEMHQDLTGDNSKVSKKLEEKRQERFVEFLASHQEQVKILASHEVFGA